MSDAVSDLVFRDLAAEAPGTPRSPEGREWEAQLREELGKLRPRRSGPRVVPAAEATGREPHISSAE
jgi:hypothetical protein